MKFKVSKEQIIDMVERLYTKPAKRSSSAKKVAIIGNGAITTPIPYNDDLWEIWGLNEMPLERADRWFEMHPMIVQTKVELDILKACKEPIYMLREYGNIPMSIAYPLGKILDKLNVRSYFVCTMAYQVALAIYEEFEEIGVWGLNLPNGSARERIFERANLEWWLGFAQGKGIKVTLDESTKLCQSNYKYGYDYFAEKTDIDDAVAAVATRIFTGNYGVGHDMACHKEIWNY